MAGAAPTTANGWTQVFADKNDMTWSGGDQAASFKHNGYTYWLFGDTMLSNGEKADGSYADGAVMVSNRILLQQGDQFTPATVGGGNAVPDPATHTAENNRRYWVQAMFAANGFVYVLSQKAENDPGSSIGFKLSGVDMAKYTQNATDGKLTLVGMINTPSTGVDAGEGPMKVQWGGDAIVSGGYVYVYGYTLAQPNGYVMHYSYVARVPVAQVDNPSAWRFYAKQSGTWKATLAELNQDLVSQHDAIAASQVTSVRLINGKYVMIHKPWNTLGTEVQIQTSPTPYGPWTTPATVFSSTSGAFEGENYDTYTPQFHPEQVLASGKVLVSISRNGQTLTDVMLNADLYKPQFYEVVIP